MLDTKPDISIDVKGFVSCLLKINGLEGNRLVAVSLGELDAAIEVLMIYIAPAEDNEAGLEFFLIGDEGHGFSPRGAWFCAESVQIIWLSP